MLRNCSVTLLARNLLILQKSARYPPTLVHQLVHSELLTHKDSAPTSPLLAASATELYLHSSTLEHANSSEDLRPLLPPALRNRTVTPVSAKRANTSEVAFDASKRPRSSFPATQVQRQGPVLSWFYIHISLSTRLRNIHAFRISDPFCSL